MIPSTVFDRLGGIRPIGDEFAPMSQAEIAVIEQAAGSPVPEDYRWFLQTFGASCFDRPLLFRPVVPLPPAISESGGAYLDVFYGAARDARDPYGLVNRMGYYTDDLPRWMLPIGDDGGGNQICLRVGRTNAGKVYYWDHEGAEETAPAARHAATADDSPTDLNNVYPIADSFTEFLQRLEAPNAV